MPNASLGGFRFAYSTGGGTGPNVEIKHVATANATAIFKGDLLKVVDGAVAAAAAGDVEIIGVCDGVEQYWDGENLRKGNYLPASTAYGTNLSRQSKVRVIMAQNAVFETDADDGVTATTEAAFQACIGENADITASAGSTVTGISGHCLDISVKGTLTAQMRIVGIARRIDQDFAASRVKLLVQVNESHLDGLAGV
jgi:hypothetical protein